jgi:hypothetical protein
MSDWQYSCGAHPDYHVPDARYNVPQQQRILSDTYFVPGAESRDFEIMAEHCAEDYHNNHDGWESSWPLEFRIWEDGVLVARISVERESRPHFSGYQMDPVP